MDTATFSLSSSRRSIINYLSRQLRSQWAASSRQVLSEFARRIWRIATRHVVDRNLCQFATVRARYREEGLCVVKELG